MQELKYIFRCPNHQRSKDLCLKLLWCEEMTNSCCYYNPKWNLARYGQDFQGCTNAIHLIPHMSMVMPCALHLLSPPEGSRIAARPLQSCALMGYNHIHQVLSPGAEGAFTKHTCRSVPGAPFSQDKYCSFYHSKPSCHTRDCHVNWATIASPWKEAGYGYILFRIAISFSGLQRSLAWKLSPLCIWVLLNEMQCKRQSITLELEALPPFQDWFLFHKLLLHGLMISLHANALGSYPGALTFHRTKNSSFSMLLWPKHFSSKHGILNTQASLSCHYQQEWNWIQKS